MPLTSLNFRPGINKEETDYSNENGWVDGNLIRFRKGRPEKLGGWQKQSASTFFGLARALHSWISLGADRYLGIGTTVKYYIESGGTYNDVTPIRVTTSAGDVTFSASSGSSTITCSDVAHGAQQNDFVTFSGAASLGGNITAAVLNQEYQILSVTAANTFTITAKDTSGATVSANSSDSGSGGSSTVGAYQINCGLDVFVPSTGYGVGKWGDGTYGSSSAITAAGQLRLWTHDNFGENLIINPRGGGIYRWFENNGVTVRALALSGISGASKVPTLGLQVITSEVDRHLIVLGADPIDSDSGNRSGAVDPMLVAFSDTENELEFNPTATNTAGSVRLSSGSLIVGGLKSRQEILIWTDTSLYSMAFIGPPLTFALNLINEGAGLISPNAAVNTPAGVFFMSKNNFYLYNGAVQQVPCSVQNYIFDDLNLEQAFKCFSSANNEHSEVWFWYVSQEDGTDEISRYAIYNYAEQSWSIGALVRYSWLDAGIEDKPVSGAGTSSAGLVYEHEKGFNDDASAMENVYIESADIDLAEGESFMFIKKLLPDLKFDVLLGVSNTPAINVVVKKRNYNSETLSTASTNQITNATTFASLRARARQLVLRFESDDDQSIEANNKDFRWRVGNTRLEVQPSGRRG
tara:strand:- start:1607 stop:3514 length:1908 start_codon:yes stop_codon:yes gene_type:complete